MDRTVGCCTTQFVAVPFQEPIVGFHCLLRLRMSRSSTLTLHKFLEELFEFFIINAQLRQNILLQFIFIQLQMTPFCVALIVGVGSVVGVLVSGLLLALAEFAFVFCPDVAVRIFLGINVGDARKVILVVNYGSGNYIHILLDGDTVGTVVRNVNIGFLQNQGDLSRVHTAHKVGHFVFQGLTVVAGFQCILSRFAQGEGAVLLCSNIMGNTSGSDVRIVCIQRVIGGQTESGAVQFNRQVVVQHVGIVSITVVKNSNTNGAISHLTGFCQEIEAVGTGYRGGIGDGLTACCCPWVGVTCSVSGSGADLQAVKRSDADGRAALSLACLDHFQNLTFTDATGNGAVFFQIDLVILLQFAQSVEVVAFKAVFGLLNLPIGNTIQCAHGVHCQCFGMHSVREGVVGTPGIIRDLILKAVDADLFTHCQTICEHTLQNVFRQAACLIACLDRAIGIVEIGIHLCHLGIFVQRDGILGEGDTNVIVVKFQIHQGSFAIVGQFEGVTHLLAGIDITVVTGGNAVLVTALLGQHGRVNDLNVGLDAEVGSGTVTLHVEEVKVVSLTVLQSTESGHIVQIDFCLGDGVGRTQVQNADAVDEQVDVIVAGEGEVQVVIVVVDELCMTFQGQKVVGVVIVLVPVGGAGGDHITVGVAGNTVTQINACTAHTQRVKTGSGQGITTYISLCSAIGLGDGEIACLGIVDFTVGIVIFGTIVLGVKYKAGITVGIGGLDQMHSLIVANRHAVAVAASDSRICSTVTPGVVQQEVGCLVPGCSIGNHRQFSCFKLCLCICICALGIGEDAAADHICQIINGSIGIANILIVFVEQLMTDRIVGIIGAIRLIGNSKYLLHIVRQVIDSCLSIYRLALGVQFFIDQIGTDKGAVDHLFCLAVQSNFNRFRFIFITPGAVQNQICSFNGLALICRQIVDIVCGASRQQGEASGIALVVSCASTRYLHSQRTATISQLVFAHICTGNSTQSAICTA